jgi:hypothetical protein
MCVLACWRGGGREGGAGKESSWLLSEDRLCVPASSQKVSDRFMSPVEIPPGSRLRTPVIGVE